MYVGAAAGDYPQQIWRRRCSARALYVYDNGPDSNGRNGLANSRGSRVGHDRVCVCDIYMPYNTRDRLRASVLYIDAARRLS